MARKRLLPKATADLPALPYVPPPDGVYEHAVVLNATLATGAVRAPSRVPEELRADLQRLDPGLLAHLDARLGQLAALREEGRRAAIYAPVRAEEPEGTIPQALLKEVWLLTYAATKLAYRAFQFAGINRKRYDTWYAHDADFREDVAACEAIFDGRIEEVLFRRILAADAINDKGSPLLTIFYLNAHKRPVYKAEGAPPPPGTPMMSLDMGIDNPYLLPAATATARAQPLLPAPTEPIVDGDYREEPLASPDHDPAGR